MTKKMFAYLFVAMTILFCFAGCGDNSDTQSVVMNTAMQEKLNGTWKMTYITTNDVRNSIEKENNIYKFNEDKSWQYSGGEGSSSKTSLSGTYTIDSNNLLAIDDGTEKRTYTWQNVDTWTPGEEGSFWYINGDTLYLFSYSNSSIKVITEYERSK